MGKESPTQSATHREEWSHSLLLTGKASSWPRHTQMPEMEESPLCPNTSTEAKAFFRSFSSRWNMPAEEHTRG